MAESPSAELLAEARAAAVSADASVEIPADKPALALPCPARDPEDGRCYPSADAADLAWLARSGNPLSLARRSADAPEEDPDDPDDSDETGDGGSADSSAKTAMSPARLAFWKNLARSVTGLIVRKTNNRPVSVPEEELAELFATDFPLPLAAFDRVKFRDTFLSGRGRRRRHHAIDLPAPRGTPVLAVADGVIERLGRDTKGGKVVYLRDTTGKYTFFYAHLSRHEKSLRPGDHVVKGQRLGEVGATGHVVGGPHLHFAIFRDEDTAGRALVVNPYLIFSPLVASR